MALLEFRIDAGDTVLKEHLLHAKENARYTSKTIQNECISLAGNAIVEDIVAEINHNKIFAILADEASDNSYKEQLPLVLRFVDKENIIREEFMGFHECLEGVSGEAISKLLLSPVEALGLTWTIVGDNLMIEQVSIILDTQFGACINGDTASICACR